MRNWTVYCCLSVMVMMPPFCQGFAAVHRAGTRKLGVLAVDAPTRRRRRLDSASSQQTYSSKLNLPRAILQANKLSSSPGNEIESDETMSFLVQLASSPIGALAVLLCVVLFHECGHYLAARSIGVQPQEFSIGFGPKLFGFHAFGDGGAFNLRAIPAGGYVRFSPESLLPLPWQERIFISSAGVVFNWIMSFAIYFGQILFGQGLLQFVMKPGILVSELVGKDAAANGKLYPGDAIVGVNGDTTIGTSIARQSPTSEAQAQRAISKLISMVQATPVGDSLCFSVLRANRSSANKPVDVFVTPKRSISSNNSGSLGPPTVGAILVPNIVGMEQIKSESALETASLASQYTFAIAKETATGLTTFVGDILTGKGKTSDYAVRGPVGVIQKASGIVATQDWTRVLNYAAGISLNLAVVNLLPVPPADGFQIVFVLAERFLKN